VTPPTARRVHLTPASAVRVAAVAIGTLALLTALDRSRLILYWLVTAAAAALLLDGLVRGLVPWVRRGIAIATVTVLTLAGAALLTHGVVDAVVDQYDALRTAAPKAAAALERSDRVGDLAERLELGVRTDELTDRLPERLLGSPADVARTAAQNLGEAVLVITLAVFMLVAYERFEQRVHDLDESSRRTLGRWVGLDAGVASGARCARVVIGRVMVLGVLTGLVAQVADLPAPIALGLWMAWWRLLPLLGVVVGYAPLVLVLVTDRSDLAAVTVLLVLAGGEAAVRWTFGTAGAPGVLHLPMGAVTAVAFTAGVEMAGVVGAVVGVVVAHVLVGALHGVAGPDPDGEPASDETAADGPPAASGHEGTPGAARSARYATRASRLSSRA
jgi:predicted PurR-regulated permease PerM